MPMYKLSIVIPCRNDFAELNHTIASIRQTAGNRPEIVAVDDQSEIPFVSNDPKTIVIRNIERAGVAGSRHIGATYASGDWLLFIDAHMRFPPGWYEILERSINKADEGTVFCGVCAGLSPGNMDLSKHEGLYHGATLNLYGPDRNDPRLTQVFEGVWAPPKKEAEYEIPCLMGAIYAMRADWFFHIGGLRLLRGWGSDEPYLSLKTWLAGGSIRLLKSFVVGHQFRTNASYTTEAWMPLFNKLVSIITLMPDAECSRLISKLPAGPDLLIAQRQVRLDAGQVLSDQAWNRRIFTRTFDWYLKRFNIPFIA